MKRRFYLGIVFMAMVLLISGVNILAFATPASRSDPIITLSYLTNVFRPRIMEDVRSTEQQMVQRFNERINSFELPGNPPAKPGPADAFAVVTLSRGQSLTCSVGVEIMLRIGSATATGSAPALVDYTSGSTLSSGGALRVNHMYLVTIEGNGISATADTVRVLVRGVYRIT